MLKMTTQHFILADHERRLFSTVWLFNNKHSPQEKSQRNSRLLKFGCSGRGQWKTRRECILNEMKRPFDKK